MIRSNFHIAFEIIIRQKRQGTKRFRALYLTTLRIIYKQVSEFVLFLRSYK